MSFSATVALVLLCAAANIARAGIARNTVSEARLNEHNEDEVLLDEHAVNNDPNQLQSICGINRYMSTNANNFPSSILAGLKVSRVVGGANARPNFAPWMARVKKDGEHQCGGAILNSRTILTAAHCIQRLEKIKG